MDKKLERVWIMKGGYMILWRGKTTGRRESLSLGIFLLYLLFLKCQSYFEQEHLRLVL